MITVTKDPERLKTEKYAGKCIVCGAEVECASYDFSPIDEETFYISCPICGAEIYKDEMKPIDNQSEQCIQEPVKENENEDLKRYKAERKLLQSVMEDFDFSLASSILNLMNNIDLNYMENGLPYGESLLRDEAKDLLNDAIDMGGIVMSDHFVAYYKHDIPKLSLSLRIMELGEYYNFKTKDVEWSE